MQRKCGESEGRRRGDGGVSAGRRRGGGCDKMAELGRGENKIGMEMRICTVFAAVRSNAKFNVIRRGRILILRKIGRKSGDFG